MLTIEARGRREPELKDRLAETKQKKTEMGKEIASV
jgi:hypothetical protein